MRDTRLKLNTHPVTGRALHPLGFRRDGRPIWPVLGGSEPTGQPPATGAPPAAPPPTPAPAPAAPPAGPPKPTPPQPAPTPPAGDKGYPENTPVAEMTTEQQAAYWKAQSRKHEAAFKGRGDYDALKEKAAAHDALIQTTKTDQERAVDQAKKEAADAARAEERTKLGPPLVRAHLKAALTGRLADEQRDALLESVDAGRFLGKDGADVDETAVQEWADKVAPKPTGPGRTPDLGQGRRQEPATSGVQTGSALYAERHPKRTPT